MVTDGVELDHAVRRARKRLKGLRGSHLEPLAAVELSVALARRESYRLIVHARFDLDEVRQATLSAAVHFARAMRAGRRSKLRRQIASARRVKVDVESLP